MEDRKGDGDDAHHCAFEKHEERLIVEQLTVESGVQLGDTVRAAKYDANGGCHEGCGG